MSFTTAGASFPEWLTARQSRLIAGCSPTALQRAALLRQIRVKLDPGIPPRYHRDDVAKFAEARSGRQHQRAGA